MAELLTPRLKLRLMDSDDDKRLYRELYTSPEVMARIVAPLSAEAVDAAFERVRHHNRQDEPGHRFWTIAARDTGEALGLAALLREGGRAELGVMLLPAAWQRRVSTEAFTAVLPHAFGAMGLDLVDAQRPDDDHALVIDRLLAPFGFERGPATRPGCARWLLPRDRWTAAPTPAERLGITPPAE